MDLSIIIVNYNSAAHVNECVASIIEQTKKYSYEIIIVDNASTDNSVSEIKAKNFPLRWLDMGYNSGFARANNAGIKISNGDYVLLLNADTIILNAAIDTCISLFKQHQEVAVSGVQLLNPDGSDQISGAYLVKGGLNNLLPLPYLGDLVRSLGYKLKQTKPSIEKIEDYVEVDWIVGAFMMLKKEVLNKSGLMDEDFFMYAEEIEWCSRLQKQGKICLFGQAKVIHLLGGTSNSFYKTTEKQNTKNVWNKKGKQIMLSNLVRIRKQYGIGWFLVTFFCYLAEIPIFFFGLLFSKIFKPSKVEYAWKNVSEYSVNTLLLSSYFFRILFNRPYFYKLK